MGKSKAQTHFSYEKKKKKQKTKKQLNHWPIMIVNIRPAAGLEDGGSSFCLVVTGSRALCVQFRPADVLHAPPPSSPLHTMTLQAQCCQPADSSAAKRKSGPSEKYQRPKKSAVEFSLQI
jgi:hypothetical protein